MLRRDGTRDWWDRFQWRWHWYPRWWFHFNTGWYSGNAGFFKIHLLPTIELELITGVMLAFSWLGWHASVWFRSKP